MKNKKGESSNPLMIIMGALIFILIAIAFINSVADTKARQTDLITIANESYNLSSNGCYPVGLTGTVNITDSDCNITVTEWYAAGDWRLSSSQCDLSSVTITNVTGTALTEDTDYEIFADTGIIRLLNTSTLYNSSGTMSNNGLRVNYDYCGSSYLTSSGDRGLANLWTTMMIIVLIAGLAVAVKKIWGE
jgi:hypothetical protein